LRIDCGCEYEPDHGISQEETIPPSQRSTRSDQRGAQFEGVDVAVGRSVGRGCLQSSAVLLDSCCPHCPPLENTGSWPSEPSRPVSCFSTRRAFSRGSPLVPTQMLSTSFSTVSSRIAFGGFSSPILQERKSGVAHTHGRAHDEQRIDDSRTRTTERKEVQRGLIRGTFSLQFARGIIWGRGKVPLGNKMLEQETYWNSAPCSEGRRRMLRSHQ
jgi:hypothetical protein